MFRVGQKRSSVIFPSFKGNYKRYKTFRSKRYSGFKNWGSKRVRTYGVSSSGKRNFPSRAIKDEVLSPKDGVINGSDYSDYFNLPSLGQGVDSRHTNRVKVWSMNLDGRFHIRNIDQTMGEDQNPVVENIEGYVGIFVILDRMPVPTGVPSFSDVFGELSNTDGSRLDQHVRVDQLSRFKVLVRERKYVNENVSGTMFTLKRFLKFNGRNRIVTSFKDMGVNTTGRYGNIRDNAIFMFVVWDSSVASVLRYSINSRIVYFH